MTRAVVEGEYIYGVAAVTTTLVEGARSLHGASPTAAAALGRLLTGGVLLGSLLKESWHRLILQVNCRGPVRQILVEADGAGHVRGYLGQAAIRVPSRQGKLDVGRAVGKGILHVIKEIGLEMPVTGTVPLVSGEIAEDLAAYLLQSEQLPSAVSLGVFVSPDHTVTAAGGLLIQFLATVADDLVAHIENALAALPPVSTLVREGCQPQEMLQQALGGLPLQVLRDSTPTWQCPCSRERVMRALVALGREELHQLSVEEEESEIRCEFCTARYVFSRQALVALRDEAS